jgi:uncharacterized protein YuzE
MTVTIGGTTFDRVDYDAEADVLYLHVGDPSTAVRFDETPEGHALRFDATGRMVGITVVGVREHQLSDGRLIMTIPSLVEVAPEDLAAIIHAA